MVRKANEAGVVLLSFDNVIDDPKNIQINVDQVGSAVMAGDFLLKETTADPATSCSCAVLPASRWTSLAPRASTKAIAASGRKVNVTEVVGNWAPGDAQKVTADAIAAGGVFDGIYVEGGSQGAAQAMLDAGKFIVPMSGEDENAFRMLCNDNHDKGMHCQSGGTGPAQSAVTIKTAIAALKGEKSSRRRLRCRPRSRSRPYKVGEQVFPDLPGSLFTGNNFPACNIGFTVEEIARQTGDNN